MNNNWITQWLIWILFLKTALCQLNTPPTMYVDRTWKLRENEPIGTVVARVDGKDNENDPLEYGLEPYGFNGAYTEKNLPFIIDNVTGVVTLNESLAGRSGEKFFLYVTVNDGDLTAKNEVFVNILGATETQTQRSRPKLPTGIQNGFTYNHPYSPPEGTRLRPSVPQVVNRPKTFEAPINKTIKPQVEADKKKDTPVSTPVVPPTLVNSTVNTTNVLDLNDLAFTIGPIAAVCGVLVVIAVVMFLFRRRLCKRRLKSQKDDMRKEVSGCMSLDEPMAMQHWRGPRAFSNRYEGWNSDRNIQPPPIQNDRDIKIGDKWEFPRHHLKVFNILGEGCFGQVWRCEALDIDGQEGTSVVAVKTLKENAGTKERTDLIQELEVMKNMEPHPNVVRLLGCCTDKDPLFVIMEFIPYGKLQSFLRSSRAERYYGNMHGQSDTLTSRDLTSFAYQCARGMEFLSSKGIIHRDLAARNILVGEERTCKVADFGFARDIVGSHVYERKSEGRLPIRWMAPESLYDNIFSVKSDVWSFGVLLWEIVTLGSTPYPGLAAADVMRKVRDGYRLDKPDHCRREVYNIMYYCWDKDPADRPSFTELVQLLEQLLLSETEYIELERFPDHSYYNMVSLSGEKL